MSVEPRAESVEPRAESLDLRALTDQLLVDAMIGDDMSRSRGRGPKPKSKSRAKPQAKAAPQPFMMFQIFDRHPWMQLRWAEELAPKGLDADAMVRELVKVIRKHMVPVLSAKANEVRVSGVPYSVPAERVNGHEADAEHEPEAEPESRPQYPY